MKISTADKVTIYTHAMSLSFNACHVFRRGACMQQNMWKTISFNQHHPEQSKNKQTVFIKKIKGTVRPLRHGEDK